MTSTSSVPLEPVIENLSSFREWLVELGMSSNTAAQYSQAVERWVTHLTNCDEVSPCRAWREWSATPSTKRLSGYAGRQYSIFASDVLRCSIDLGIPRHLPPNSQPAPAPLTRAVQLALARQAKLLLKDSQTFRVWLAFLLESGCRRSETILAWKNFDLGASTVTVLGKGGRLRTLPLSRRMVRLLRFHRSRAASPWGGRKADTLYRQFTSCAKALGLTLKVHQTRATCITRLVLAPGGNILDVGAFVGHANPASSLRWYYKTPLSRLRDMLTVSLRPEKLAA
jgi:integrase